MAVCQCIIYGTLTLSKLFDQTVCGHLFISIARDLFVASVFSTVGISWGSRDRDSYAPACRCNDQFCHEAGEPGSVIYTWPRCCLLPTLWALVSIGAALAMCLLGMDCVWPLRLVFKICAQRIFPLLRSTSFSTILWKCTKTNVKYSGREMLAIVVILSKGIYTETLYLSCCCASHGLFCPTLLLLFRSWCVLVLSSMILSCCIDLPGAFFLFFLLFVGSFLLLASPSCMSLPASCLHTRRMERCQTTAFMKSRTMYCGYLMRYVGRSLLSLCACFWPFVSCWTCLVLVWTVLARFWNTIDMCCRLWWAYLTGSFCFSWRKVTAVARMATFGALLFQISQRRSSTDTTVIFVQHLVHRLLSIMSRPARLLECLEFDPETFYQQVGRSSADEAQEKLAALKSSHAVPRYIQSRLKQLEEEADGKFSFFILSFSYLLWSLSRSSFNFLQMRKVHVFGQQSVINDPQIWCCICWLLLWFCFSSR